MKKNLYQHQRALVEAFPERHALIWETGTGKTLAATELAKLTEERVLVIVPKALKTQWQEFLKKEEPILHHLFLVMTKEEFKRDWKILPDFPCVVVDEAHYHFGTKSQQMKALRGYFTKHKTKYRYFLTATPYRSTPMDIYIMSDLLGRPMDYWKFFHKFFYKIPMGRLNIPKIRDGIEPEIAKIVNLLGSTVKMAECVDMPEQNYDVEYFQLTESQMKGMKAVPDLLPIVRFTKYHQICGGTLRGDEYTEAQSFTSDKKDRLIELAASNDRMIVSCRYNHELKYLSDCLQGTDHEVHIINGEVSGPDRHAIIEKFKKSPKYILLVNAACSEGWELPECPLMIFYSLDFSLKNFIQMQGRILRINHIKKNTYLFLVVKGTIDEDVYESIKRKEDFHLEIYAKEHTEKN